MIHLHLKRHFLFISLLLVCLSASGQDSSQPKLIVGIIVDQMRYDYITRYWDKYGDEGFRKLVNEGYNCSNTHYSYIPTYTGPGHASVYAGTTPSVHGIIGNYWFNRKKGRMIYVTEDSTVTGVGATGSAGNMSPANLVSSNIGDEMRLASNFRSKIIGVSLKDRSSILPAGHAANAAYWFDSKSGNWISSTWYMQSLPQWVNTYNSRNRAAQLLGETWTPLLPPNNYSESTTDDSPYEDLFPGETNPVFPHKFIVNADTGYNLLRYVPNGNVFTREFAVEAMKNEQLGKDEFTDLLAVSFSAPDYSGHQYGTHAMETEDMYLRLDKELAELIRQVESWAGKENVLFFLTADHAAIPNVGLLAANKIPAGIFNIAMVTDSLQKFLTLKYGPGKWLLTIENNQVYLDHNLIAKNKHVLSEMIDECGSFLLRFDGIKATLSASDLMKNEYTKGIRSMIQNGYYPKRSGDLAIILEPGLVEYKPKGTDHGSGYSYDTHVPLLFYGWKIKKGQCSRQTDIIDIAPTLSQILGIQPPNGCTGKVIGEVLGY